MVERSTRREDLQMISDLIDGRLADSERAEAIRRLEADEALYEVFVETARYRGTRAKPSIVLFPRRRVAAVGGLLAAALAFVVVLPRLGGPEPLSPPALAKALNAEAGLAAILAAPDWFEPLWSSMRGITAAPSPGADAAFRIGVQSLDLEVALRARRRGQAAILAQRLALSISGLEASALALGYRHLGLEVEAHEESASLAGLLDTSGKLAVLVADDPQIDELSQTFGRWCEAGRLAAASGNTELLTSEAFREFVLRLAERDDWDPEIALEIERLRDLLQPELNELQVAAIAVSFEAILAQG